MYLLLLAADAVLLLMLLLPPLLMLLLPPLLLLLPAVVPPACAAFARSSFSAISYTQASPVPESNEGMPRSVRQIPFQSNLHFSLRADPHLFKALTSHPCVGDHTRVSTPNDGQRLRTKCLFSFWSVNPIP